MTTTQQTIDTPIGELTLVAQDGVLGGIYFSGHWTRPGRSGFGFGDPALARMVGRAVGRNPLSLIVPCHRVLGGDGSITGYAGGLDRMRRLLALEAGLGSRWDRPDER